MTSLSVPKARRPALRPPKPLAPRAGSVEADLVQTNGFRVDGPSGRIGTVVGLVFGAWIDRPDAIEVRVGLFRPGVLVVSADNVAAVLPHKKRVILSQDVDLAEATRAISQQ